MPREEKARHLESADRYRVEILSQCTVCMESHLSDSQIEYLKYLLLKPSTCRIPKMKESVGFILSTYEWVLPPQAKNWFVT